MLIVTSRLSLYISLGFLNRSKSIRDHLENWATNYFILEIFKIVFDLVSLHITKFRCDCHCATHPKP